MLDLLHVLKRRRVDFQRWCDEQGIVTLEDFMSRKVEIEQDKEYFVSQEMVDLATATLPKETPSVVQVVLNTDPSPVITVVEGSEDPAPKKARKKSVQG